MKAGAVLKNMRRIHQRSMLLSLLCGVTVFFLFSSARTPLLLVDLRAADRILQGVLIGIYMAVYFFVYRVKFQKRMTGLRRSSMAAAEKLAVFRKAVLPLWICLALLCLLCGLAFALTLNLAYVLLGLFTLFFLWLLAPEPGRLSVILGETEETIKIL